MFSFFAHASPHIPDNQLGFVAKKNNTKRFPFQSQRIKLRAVGFENTQLLPNIGQYPIVRRLMVKKPFEG
jgi:hypothetical protein